MGHPGVVWLLACALSVLAMSVAVAAPEADGSASANESRAAIHDGREYLVPDLAAGSFAIDDGPRGFLDRLSFSPAFGRLGAGKLYTVRATYHPQRWLGWEAAVAHNPGRSVHALVHTVGAVVRYPLPGRVQPYGSIGYGMIFVFPGQALNTDPVTGNVFAAGGGLEFYVRNDLAIRFDARHLTVPGSDATSAETVAYEYGELTVGLSFYRGIEH